MSLPSYAMNQASFPEMYERELVGPLFRPWVGAILDDVAAVPGKSLLDVACGTGIVARVAKERLRTEPVVGIDASADMLAVARAVGPDIDWREGSAEALPLRDGEQFDVVVCQQGLQFFRDKPAAVAQMRCALRKGGRVAAAVWRSDDEIPLFRDLRRVGERHLGAIHDQRYGFGDAVALEGLFRDAGFNDVRSKKVSLRIRFDNGHPFVRLNAMALVGMSARGPTLSAPERSGMVDAIVADSTDVLKSYGDGPALAFELSTNLATARR